MIRKAIVYLGLLLAMVLSLAAPHAGAQEWLPIYLAVATMLAAGNIANG